MLTVSLPDKFQTREYRFVRAIVFTMLGMWGVVPVTHLLLTHGHVWAIRTAFRLDMLMGLIYLVSTAVWCSPAFDVWLAVSKHAVLKAMLISCSELPYMHAASQFWHRQDT